MLQLYFISAYCTVQHIILRAVYVVDFTSLFHNNLFCEIASNVEANNKLWKLFFAKSKIEAIILPIIASRVHSTYDNN